MFVNAFHECGNGDKELDVLFRCFCRGKQVLTCVCNKGVVVVFAGTVNACKRFFVQKTNHIMSERCLSHYIHNQLVVIAADVGVIVNAGKFKLTRGNFVMLCFCGNAQSPKLIVNITHKFSYTFHCAAVVVIAQFLAFGTHCTEDGSACFPKVKSFVKQFFVNKEVFLLGTYGRFYICNVFNACVVLKSGVL